jgi:hypothetical protein
MTTWRGTGAGDEKERVIPLVENDTRAKIDSIRTSAVDEARRDRMLRWAFWMFFLLATMCAFAWKVAYASMA